MLQLRCLSDFGFLSGSSKGCFRLLFRSMHIQSSFPWSDMFLLTHEENVCSAISMAGAMSSSMIVVVASCSRFDN